jgi:hypothetical protein
MPHHHLPVPKSPILTLAVDWLAVGKPPDVDSNAHIVEHVGRQSHLPDSGRLQRVGPYKGSDYWRVVE